MPTGVDECIDRSFTRLRWSAFSHSFCARLFLNRLFEKQYQSKVLNCSVMFFIFETSDVIFTVRLIFHPPWWLFMLTKLVITYNKLLPSTLRHQITIIMFTNMQQFFFNSVR